MRLEDESQDRDSERQLLNSVQKSGGSPEVVVIVGRIYDFFLSWSVVIRLSFSSPFPSVLGQWCQPSGRKCLSLAKLKAPNLFTLEHRAIAGREALLPVCLFDLFNRL